jgi:hypothetical protein
VSPSPLADVWKGTDGRVMGQLAVFVDGTDWGRGPMRKYKSQETSNPLFSGLGSKDSRS